MLRVVACVGCCPALVPCSALGLAWLPDCGRAASGAGPGRVPWPALGGEAGLLPIPCSGLLEKVGANLQELGVLGVLERSSCFQSPLPVELLNPLRAAPAELSPRGRLGTAGCWDGEVLLAGGTLSTC